ncbi:MAG: motility protein A [Lachnospira sp.]
MGKFNKTGIMGLVMCFAAIIFGIATNGGIKTIVNFLHLPSFIVTLGGAMFAVMATADSFQDYIYGLKGIVDAYKNPTLSVEHISNKLLELSETARREGLLSLEQSVDEEDAFFQKGVKLVVDGSSPELVKDILETELYHKEDRDKKRIKFWQDFAAFAPAWGMVGTLLGLINMMKSMGNDPGAIGAGMSLALITTLYGSVIANWICVPVSRKLEKSSSKEYLIMELIIEGVLSIQSGENPRIIKEKIKSIIDGKESEELEDAA